MSPVSTSVYQIEKDQELTRRLLWNGLLSYDAFTEIDYNQSVELLLIEWRGMNMGIRARVKIYNCFKLVWTWFTNKLGEIYFQYNGTWSFVCDDYKLRWVFKIWAWWWWYLNDTKNNSEKWKLYLDKINTNWFYYHNGDNAWWWTWQARIEWIGFSNWNNAKTELNLREVFSNIKVQTTISWNWSEKANGSDKKDISLIITYNWKRLSNFTVDNIFFLTWTNTDIEKNWKTIAGFKYTWWKTTNKNGIITWNVSSLIWWNGLNYKLWIKKWNNITYWKWTTNFLYPFQIKLLLK